MCISFFFFILSLSQNYFQIYQTNVSAVSKEYKLFHVLLVLNTFDVIIIFSSIKWTKKIRSRSRIDHTIIIYRTDVFWIFHRHISENLVRRRKTISSPGRPSTVTKYKNAPHNNPDGSCSPHDHFRRRRVVYNVNMCLRRCIRIIKSMEKKREFSPGLGSLIGRSVTRDSCPFHDYLCCAYTLLHDDIQENIKTNINNIMYAQI